MFNACIDAVMFPGNVAKTYTNLLLYAADIYTSCCATRVLIFKGITFREGQPQQFPSLHDRAHADHWNDKSQ